MKPSFKASLVFEWHSRLRGAHGFTLLELLVVVTIISVIAGVALLALEGVRDDADDKIALYEMTQIRNALRQFRLDVGHFPDNASGVADNLRVGLLVSCNQGSDVGCSDWDPDTRRGWKGPYVTSEAVDDPWGPNCEPDGAGTDCKEALDHRYRLLNPENDGPNDTPPARLLSHGPNGVYEGDNFGPNTGNNYCAKYDDITNNTPKIREDSDDLVLCLLQ